tara:strand:+ start:359 stop:466 length:108 start_codon:yes stop_codon:yes gene_type:complete
LNDDARVSTKAAVRSKRIQIFQRDGFDVSMDLLFL